MSPGDLSRLEDELRAYGQLQLLTGWDQLSPTEQSSLRTQIGELDFEEIARLVPRALDAAENTRASISREPLPATRLDERHPRYMADQAREQGEGLLREGKLAVLLVAGGQGSRLGFPHPKGMLPVGPVSGRTLFQIFADGIAGIEERFERGVPLLIMTSPATHQETCDYWRANDFLGLDPKEITFFQQGTMPAVDAKSGEVLLERVGQIVASPDGHGGMLNAMTRAGLWSGLERRGIEQLFYFQVDNPLVAIADPIFLGYHLLAGAEMTSQVVAKRDPLERVGNVVMSDGTMRIIEYSDLQESEARMTQPDGSLALWAGSIAVHAFRMDFLKRMAGSASALPFHFARKAVPHVDRCGQFVVPIEPNAIKFERFIFDILPLANHPWVVEVDPAEGFAPIKNGADAATDTLRTAQDALTNRARRWCVEAGILVSPQVRVEISARHALGPGELARRHSPGTTIHHDTYLA